MLGVVLYGGIEATMAEICLPSLKSKGLDALIFATWLVFVECEEIAMLCKCKISCCRMVKLRILDFASNQQ